MKEPYKTRWLEDLRSGKFQQGRNRLCKPVYKNGQASGQYTHCCLGVLAEGVREELNAMWLEPDSNGGLRFSLPTNTQGYGYGHVTYLPLPVLELTGLDYDAQVELTEMNDGGRSFEEIANWIKENL